MSPQTISQYKSRDDLIEVLLASCTIPFYFSGYPATQLQRDLSYAVDGVFSFEIDRFDFIIVTSVLKSKIIYLFIYFHSPHHIFIHFGR